jgi:tetrapyrrole methylase family protein / MazG family protein
MLASGLRTSEGNDGRKSSAPLIRTETASARATAEKFGRCAQPGIEPIIFFSMANGAAGVRAKNRPWATKHPHCAGAARAGTLKKFQPMAPDDNEKLAAGPAFARLVEIMAKLRAPGGCPWDREQNFDTIKPYLVEEAYEVMDAIDARDFTSLAEELGDLLLQPVFFAQMASEEGKFDIADSLHAINSKLVRRHPHVFAQGDAKTADDVKRKWDEIKAEEKPRPKGLLDGIPRATPALVEAQQIASKAAGAGFDWENVEQVFAKLDEELAELREAGTHDAIEGEIGDLLFVIVNIARFMKVDPEQALRKTNAKFRRRFAHVEAGLAAQGKTPREATIAQMEELWQESKQND